MIAALNKKLHVCAKNKGKNKDIILVLNQLISVLLSINIHAKNKIEALKIALKEGIEIENNKESPNRELINHTNKILDNDPPHNLDVLITENDIQRIHKTLSNYMDNNNNGLPGEYRPEGAMIDFDTVFLSPVLISFAMKKLIADHRTRFNNKKIYNPILEACKKFQQT